jgi:subtilase family serine protease
LLVAPVTLLAQQDRIVVPIEPGRTVVLTGNVSPKARPQFDQGPVDPSLKLDLLTLVLKPTPQQQAALEQLLIEQQGRSSANYHRWLSPLEYAGRFGLSQNDIGKAKAWLESQGFAVSYVSHGRNWITLQVTIRI